MKNILTRCLLIGLIIASSSSCDADLEIDQTVEQIKSAQPTITAVNPTSAAVNSTVTVEGTFLNFATKAFIGTTEAQITSRITGQRLEIKVPNNATEGPVRIVTEQGKEATSEQSLSITYPVPVVSSTIDSEGFVNATISLEGTDLIGITAIKFGTATGTIEFQESQALVVRIPNSPGFSDISITYLSTSGEVSQVVANNFEIILPQPQIGAFPSVMSRDNEVVVTGEDMNLITGGDVAGLAITFNEQTPNLVRFNVPAGVTTGYVDVNLNFDGGGVISQTNIPYINGQFEQYYEFDTQTTDVMSLDLGKDPGANHQLNRDVPQPPFPGTSYYSLEMTTATGSTIGRTKVQDNTSNPTFENVLDPGNYGDNPVMHFWLNSNGTQPVFVLYFGGTSNPNRRRWQNSTTNTGTDWQLVAIRLKDFIPGQTSVGGIFEMRITTGSNTPSIPVQFNWDWVIVTDKILTEFGAVDVTDEFSAAG